MKINEFRGKYFYLSNFYTAPVKYDGLTYANNEAAFQAAKLKDNDYRDPKTKLTRNDFTTMAPNMAKSYGKRVTLRSDWEQIKNKVMYDIVNDKFTRNKQLQMQLMSTGEAVLEEGNTWHDTYWGVDIKTGKGRNQLGNTLMTIRNNIKKS